MHTIEQRLTEIEHRNSRVEGDKAWEISRTRRLLIMAATYLSVLIYGYAIDVRYPALNAIIPTAGFLLSTLALPAIKKRWLAQRQKPQANL